MGNQVLEIKKFLFKDEKVLISRERIEYDDYMNQSLSTIVDNDFLMLTKEYPDFELAPKIKVYARISP